MAMTRHTTPARQQATLDRLIGRVRCIVHTTADIRRIRYGAVFLHLDDGQWFRCIRSRSCHVGVIRCS